MKTRLFRHVALILALVTAFSVILSVASFADENGVESVTLGKVKANGLNLREKPDTDAKVLTVIPEGTKIAVAETEDGWTKVMIGGYVGYVSGKYIEKLEDGDANLSYGKTIGDVVYMRAGPSTSYPIAARMLDNSYVKIKGIEDGWFKVETLGGRYSGYMHPNYVLPVKRTEVEGEPEPEPQQNNNNNNSSGSSNSGKKSSSSGKNSSSGSKQSSKGATKAEKLISIAKSYIGVKYVWGGETPKGFDCGGFTKYCYGKMGVTLPHMAQINCGSKVSYSNLKMGDLVFFSGGGKRYGHVGIYISGGRFIHAPSPGKTVTIDTLASGYYYSHFTGARRIFG